LRARDSTSPEIEAYAQERSSQLMGFFLQGNSEDPRMKRHQLISAVAAALLIGATSAAADCREELARLEGGISKDGSLAPLQSPADATPQAGGAADAEPSAADSGTIAKDGETEPLQTDPSLATSGQDAQAQSQGGATAAEQAAGAAGGPDRAAAVEQARAALDAGDEAACMEAVKAAKGA
jgi:hypothetical protein